MISDTDFAAWLNDSTVDRTLLFELDVNIAGVEQTLYVSNKGYVTTPADTPANTSYKPIVSSSLKPTETLTLDGSASLSVAEIEFYNGSGRYDEWLTYVWMNRGARGYIGDPRWTRSDFRMVYNGLSYDINPKGIDKISLKMTDKMGRLNTPLIESKIGGDATYTQSGNLVSVYKPAHIMNIGSPVEIHIVDGAAISGSYQVTSTPSADIFTYLAFASATTSGNLTIGGTNADTVEPTVFGEIHNQTPLLRDATTLTYQFGKGSNERLIEVRDSGQVIATYTTNLAQGTFTLTKAAAGLITCSVQGDNNGGYVNTVAGVVKRMVKNYGKDYDRFTDTDIDLTNFAAFDTAHPQIVGVTYTDRVNVFNACQEVASSISAQLVPSRLGLLRLLQINLPPTGTPTIIKLSAQQENTLVPSTRTIVSSTVKIAYNKNYTLQPDLLTSIPEWHKELFNTEYLTVSDSNPTVETLYRLNSEPVQETTALQVRADAVAEASRRKTLRTSVHTTYTFEGTPTNMLLQLGDTVQLFCNRFQLQNGKLGVVTSLVTDWLTCRVTVGVLI